ncbi:MAG: CPBP family intramembrane glutamic endopeptidase [Synechococcaceae cyanobacterium]|nr:CPBP family intramembrane glutamic endopeptidase [Synechococcaceae cyanobacterium]
MHPSGSDSPTRLAPGGPGPAAPAWKRTLALLALLLSTWLWVAGLADSLGRPSVVDSLSLRQLELATLAGEALPNRLRPALAGDDPRAELSKELGRQLQASPLPAPAAQRLELLLLQRGTAAAPTPQEQELRTLLEQVDPERRPLLAALVEGRRLPPAEQAQLLEPWRPSTMLRQLACEQLGGPESACPAARDAGRLLLLLVGVSVVPVVLVLLGLALLLRRLWVALRGVAPTPPPLQGPPLSAVDATLLIAGGFVVLGEVVMPELLQLLLAAGLEALAVPPALAQGLQVLLLYLGLMAAPLLILAAMLPRGPRPEGGWLQWHLRPVATALGQALATVLMVLPLVALSGWLVERIWGDPGGSNPLLDLVLTSPDPRALFCFGLTAIVLAPLFEEVLFRGVLLPVAGRHLGGPAAVLMSAAVFAAAHLSLGELVPLFVLALGLGWLRWSSGRLLPCVLMHAMWNGLTFLNLVLLAQ